MTTHGVDLATRLRRWAAQLKLELATLSLAVRDPRVPWYARAVAFGVLAYAFSPIDLIPDPIPVLGHLDDVILIPLGIAIAVRLIPAPVLADCRARAAASPATGHRFGRTGAAIVVVAWLVLFGLVLVYGARLVGA